jgi:hypothetical protein
MEGLDAYHRELNGGNIPRLRVAFDHQTKIMQCTAPLVNVVGKTSLTVLEA